MATTGRLSLLKDISDEGYVDGHWPVDPAKFDSIILLVHSIQFRSHPGLGVGIRWLYLASAAHRVCACASNRFKGSKENKPAISVFVLITFQT